MGNLGNGAVAAQAQFRFGVQYANPGAGRDHLS